MRNRIKRLQKVDDIIYNLNKQISLTNLYPVNISEEKEKFFKDEKYNPQFEYSVPKVDFKDSYRKIKSLKFKDNIMDKLLKEKARETYYLLKLIENIGKKRFTNYSKKVYGEPEKSLIKKAEKLALCEECRIYEPKRKLPTKKALLKFKRVFKELNINWEVVDDEIASKALVLPTRRKLVIKKDSNFSQREIKRFIVHEIYTHILRAEFGLMQPYKVFSVGLAGYEETEEGLALYKEKRAGVLDNRSLRGYATRVLAVEKALNGSFREVFNFLNKYFGKEKAWDVAVRVKRGLKDTKEPGAFTKDMIYFSGYLKVKNFIKNQSGLHLLHYGKIGIQHALLIPSIEGLKNPFIVLKEGFKTDISKLSLLY